MQRLPSDLVKGEDVVADPVMGVISLLDAAIGNRLLGGLQLFGGQHLHTCTHKHTHPPTHTHIHTCAHTHTRVAKMATTIRCLSIQMKGNSYPNKHTRTHRGQGVLYSDRVHCYTEAC